MIKISDDAWLRRKFRIFILVLGSLKREDEMGSHTKNQKIKRSGKVIRLFIVEIADASSAPELYANPSNPYAQLIDEERLKDFNKIFGLLWAESCREASKDIYGNKKDCNV